MGWYRWRLRALLLIQIRDNYADRIIATFSVYPSSKVSDAVVEPCNPTRQLLENSVKTFVIDNESFYNILHNILKQQQSKYAKFVEWFLAKFSILFILLDWVLISPCGQMHTEMFSLLLMLCCFFLFVVYLLKSNIELGYFVSNEWYYSIIKT